MSKKSSLVCSECGMPHLTTKQKEKSGVCTFYKGICGVCKKETLVTHIRNYNWLK